ncbi:hypothetical protein OROGR_005751 [Orobanche gracilis]
MLTCITCSKQRREDGQEEDSQSPRGTPNTKDAVKSLTTQIKDMALKVSGAHKGKKAQRSNPDFDAISDSGVPYTYVSSSSTPVWNFPSTAHRSTRHGSRFGGDRTPGGLESVSAQSREAVLEDACEIKEWTAQVEPGVQITFVSLPRGGNDLKRIRFSRDMFGKWQAQRWWGENYDRIMELYNVQRFNQQAINTPGRSEDGRESIYSRLGSARESPRMTSYKPSGGIKDYFPYESTGNQHYGVGSSAYPAVGPKCEASSMEASRTTTSSRDEASVSVSNASDIESEWIEEDQPGVYITIRQIADGARELRRVRFRYYLLTNQAGRGPLE